MGENLKKKRKNNILIIILVVIFIILVAVAILLFNNKNKDKEEVPEEKAKFNEKMASDFLFNSMLISYIIEGDVQIGDGTTKNMSTGEIYYAVNDEYLKNITGLNDITDLITDNYVDYIASYLLEKAASESSNKYISFANQLYIQKKDSPCDKIPISEPRDKVKYTINDDLAIVTWNTDEELQVYFDENSKKWELITYLFTCDEKPQNYLPPEKDNNKKTKEAS